MEKLYFVFVAFLLVGVLPIATGNCYSLVGGLVLYCSGQGVGLVINCQHVARSTPGRALPDQYLDG